MEYDLEPVKIVLRSFLSEIEKVESIRKSISKPFLTPFDIEDQTPDLRGVEFTPAPQSFCEKEDAYMWLYADAWEFRSFMHRPNSNPIPEYYSQPAWPLYQQWRQEDKEVFYRKCKQITPPADGISLINYLQQLALIVSEENEHRDVWIESLRSFIQFLREDTNLHQKGPLEMLFPSKESCKGMELRKGSSLQRQGSEIKTVERRFILRRIEDTVYPIDILAASEILMNLSAAVIEGRPDVQRSAAMALGFAWLCHAAGCYRLVTRENLVFCTQLSSFIPPDSVKTKEYLKPDHFIGIASLFGVINVPISKTLYEFLLALPRDSSSNLIFNMDWENVLDIWDQLLFLLL